MNIEQTISLYLDGELSGEQEAELHHLLSVSPEARSLFREHMKLQSIARAEQTLLTPEPELRNALFSRLQGEGMSASALPGGLGSPLIDEEEPLIPAEPHRTTEQVRHRRNLAPAALVVDREPLPNQQRDEEKRRRRLIPILLPVLLAALAGSILWFDGGERISGGSQERIAAVDPERSEAMQQNSEPTTTDAAPGAVPSTDAGSVPPVNDVDRTEALSSAAADPVQHSSPVPAAPPALRRDSDQTTPQGSVTRDGGDVLNPSDGSSDEPSDVLLAHSMPPDESLEGLVSPQDFGEPVSTSLSLSSTRDDARQSESRTLA